MSIFTASSPVTADTDSTPVTATAAATTSTRGRILGTRIAGIGGLAFIANVVVNNVLRGSFPKNDASATDVATFYAEHDVLTSVFAAIYPVGLVGIALFVAGVVSRALSGPGRLSAIIGIVGSAGLVGGFSTLLAFDSAIAGYLHRGGTSTDVIEGLWVTHNAVFGVLLGSIAVALAGLASAAVSAGLLARVLAAGLAGRCRPAARRCGDDPHDHRRGADGVPRVRRLCCVGGVRRHDLGAPHPPLTLAKTIRATPRAANPGRRCGAGGRAGAPDSLSAGLRKSRTSRLNRSGALVTHEVRGSGEDDQAASAEGSCDPLEDRT